MATDTAMSDEDMRKELQNIQLKINATTDEVNSVVFLSVFVSIFVVLNNLPFLS